jgi:A/G-specific adenine glycosylase
LEGPWIQLQGEVRHTFTHFHLILDVMVAKVGDVTPDRGRFVPRTDFRPSDLPTVMRKAFDLAQK